MLTVSNALLMSSATVIVRFGVFVIVLIEACCDGVIYVV